MLHACSKGFVTFKVSKTKGYLISINVFSHNDIDVDQWKRNIENDVSTNVIWHQEFTNTAGAAELFFPIGSFHIDDHVKMITCPDKDLKNSYALTCMRVLGGTKICH